MGSRRQDRWDLIPSRIQIAVIHNQVGRTMRWTEPTIDHWD